MIVFKVVNKEDGVLSSACMWQEFRPLALIYKINEATRPKIGGSCLFAFDSVSAAKRFIRTECLNTKHTWLIYKAEATLSKKPVKSIGAPNHVKEFWAAIKHSFATNDWKDVPTGTVCCSSITLLEKVS